MQGKQAILWVTLLATAAACKKDAPPPTKLPPPHECAATDAADAAAHRPPVNRQAWNKAAVRLHLPLFRTADQGDPATVVVETWRAGETKLWGAEAKRQADLQVRAALDMPPPASPTDAEGRRQAAVLRELDQARPTLLLTDLAQDATRGDGTLLMVQHVLNAAAAVEKLYALQSGVAEMPAQISPSDTASAALFDRNQGPWCEAPLTEKDPDCTALAARPAKWSGLYPLDLQADKKFCEALVARPDSRQLLDPFAAVRRDSQGNLAAVPYNSAWPAEMAAVATELTAAADALKDPAEDALRAYLRAAAKAFTDNSWQAADEAWAKMNVDNSRWYLRIGADETYHEPCSEKAGFHVSFARIDQASRKWQALLDPLKNDMEGAIAAMAGPPYVARQVSFHLPDFIEIVLNAGDSRSPFGATIGQSLPNWGPVANEGRGRTVAMVNIGTDADSRAALVGQAQSLLCKEAVAGFDADPEPLRMSTVLHEAAHNLGPAHEYAVAGKKDGEAFGGPLAATLEELKAQTAALYLADWLADKGKISGKLRDDAHLADLIWAMGHISNGMADAQGKPKPYSQLAAIQVGWLLENEALKWQTNQVAPSGDMGCFALNHAKLPAAIAGLMKEVAGIKGRGDKAAAEKLRDRFIAEVSGFGLLREVIRTRWLRAAKASYVYGIVGWQ